MRTPSLPSSSDSIKKLRRTNSTEEKHVSAASAGRFTCSGSVSSLDVSTLRGWEGLQNQNPLTPVISVETSDFAPTSVTTLMFLQNTE
ncbi:hypothetical protein E3U43_004605 [Larimichthys crocea]|uniref:Uncharacterized protein n=1 Tax=Larimichthys crocea TaxID=215358 RepID=A0ACD3QDR4_LARCR|nr:hypothetical protein E3U43_004605 [Larimichthys crocea]